MSVELLKELCEAPGIPGREQAVIKIMQRELEPNLDEMGYGPIGNVGGLKRANRENAKKVMISGHMDEIGFVVSYIDNNGFIRFAKRGGHSPRVLLSQRVRIIGKQEITGIIEAAPEFLAEPERRKQTPELTDFFIDTGMKKVELEQFVEIGDIIVLDGKFRQQGNVYISKALDDRVGCYVIIEAMKRLKEVPIDVYAVGTAQEEVGIRGAMVAARKINPDIGIAVDITGAFDTPEVKDYQQVTQLGKGVAIKVSDQMSISNYGIVEFMKSLCKKHDIPYQLEILPFGGTDAAGMQIFGKGAVCTLSIPSRYAHTPNEMVHKDDIEATIRLLVKFIEESEECELVY